MKKLDLKKEFGELYKASAKKAAIVEVPAMNFLMIDGCGDPNGPEYQEAIEALYGVSFTVKFTVKQSTGPDYVVAPLEGLWWMEDMAKFDMEARDDWLWTAMILQLEFVTAELVKEAMAQVEAKKNPPALCKMRFEEFKEGRCAQIMHVGPYEQECATVATLHEFIAAKGCQMRGKHHEIYLSDPRRTAPEKLKTIVRQPVS